MDEPAPAIVQALEEARRTFVGYHARVDADLRPAGTQDDPLEPVLGALPADFLQRPAVEVKLALRLDPVARIGEEVCRVLRNDHCSSRTAETGDPLAPALRGRGVL